MPCRHCQRSTRPAPAKSLLAAPRRPGLSEAGVQSGTRGAELAPASSGMASSCRVCCCPLAYGRLPQAMRIARRNESPSPLPTPQSPYPTVPALLPSLVPKPLRLSFSHSTCSPAPPRAFSDAPLLRRCWPVDVRTPMGGLLSSGRETGLRSAVARAQPLSFRPERRRKPLAKTCVFAHGH